MVDLKFFILLSCLIGASLAYPSDAASSSERKPDETPKHGTPEQKDQPRAKKDVLLASPLAVSYAYDDGSYYPGKYQKAYVAAAPAAAYYSPYTALHAAAPAATLLHPAVTTYSAAYPYAYSAPLAYRSDIV